MCCVAPRPFQDFLVTAVLVFLWLVCSSAWAKGLQNVKYATDTEGIGATLALCRGTNVTCEVTEFANVRTLNISVVSAAFRLYRVSPFSPASVLLTGSSNMKQPDSRS